MHVIKGKSKSFVDLTNAAQMSKRISFSGFLGKSYKNATTDIN